MIVFDVEIKKAILGRNETPIEGIEYCKGWKDFAGMGVACVCTYDIDKCVSRVFLEEDLQEFSSYVFGKPTAGFNTRRFDITLLTTELNKRGEDFPAEGFEHYDMLEEIWITLGLNPDKFYPKTHGGWGLDAVCQATLGIAKTGHGALAPVWWQQGKTGKVIDYCLNDVWMEAKLLQHIINNGTVACPPDKVSQHGFALQLKFPVGYGQSASVGWLNPMQQAQKTEFDKAAEKIDRDIISGGLGIIR